MSGCNIKFWKQRGGYVLVKNIWHMESALNFIRFYTEDDRWFWLKMIRNKDGSYDGNSAYLIELKTERDYENEEWVDTILSKTKINGWIVEQSDKE